jgi:mRNA-degrading endonuclease RelE of RelBE toxin-antitoxin system
MRRSMGKAFQIIFTPAGTADLSVLPKLLQLEILNEFQTVKGEFSEKNPGPYKVVEQGGRRLFRHRCKDYRIYFSKSDEGITIERVLHKNTLNDFLYRSNLPTVDDES